MSTKNAISVTKKYTVQSHGIWERIRRLFAVDANRSTGVPLNPQFRNPPPGALPPESYDDPVTVPAADIADNPYWKRDVRRNYPRLSVTRQADVAGLLTLGSAANPRDDVLRIGEAGQKQLVAVRQEGEERGLAAVFERDVTASGDGKGTVIAGGVLGKDGMPPVPTPLYNDKSAPGGKVKSYLLNEEQSYQGEYPCRTFS